MKGVAIGADPYKDLDKFLHHGRTGKSLVKKFISHPNLYAERILTWTLKDDGSVETTPHESISIMLYSTRIVTYSDNGFCYLSTGGWETSTTRDRIREYLPPGVDLTTDRGDWFVTFGRAKQEYMARRRGNEWHQGEDGRWVRTPQPMTVRTHEYELPVAIIPWHMARELRRGDDGTWRPMRVQIDRIAENVTNPKTLPDNERSRALEPYLDRYMRRILTGHIKYGTVCASCIAGIPGNEHIFEHLLGCEAPNQMVNLAMSEYGYPNVTVHGISLMKHTMSNAIRRFFITHLLEVQ